MTSVRFFFTALTLILSASVTAEANPIQGSVTDDDRSRAPEATEEVVAIPANQTERTVAQEPAAGTEAQRPANRLARESSPYLLMHAHNPVDWYPWGPEAFEKARAEGKPVFLSVGYSSCYWCHVMERQVFSNQKIADVMKVMDGAIDPFIEAYLKQAGEPPQK